MKCHNCEKNAMFMVGPAGQRLPLWLDCWIRFQDVCLRNIQQLQGHMNFLESEMEYMAGLSDVPPRFAAPPPVIHAGDITLNNIHVSDSEIGVLNTGAIGGVDGALTVLKQCGNPELAAALTDLSEAVIKCSELAEETKNEIFDFLSVVSSEVLAPKERRRLAVVRALMCKLSEILSGVGALASLWEKVKAVLRRVLGL